MVSDRSSYPGRKHPSSVQVITLLLQITSVSRHTCKEDPFEVEPPYPPTLSYEG